MRAFKVWEIGTVAVSFAIVACGNSERDGTGGSSAGKGGAVGGGGGLAAAGRGGSAAGQGATAGGAGASAGGGNDGGTSGAGSGGSSAGRAAGDAGRGGSAAGTGGGAGTSTSDAGEGGSPSGDVEQMLEALDEAVGAFCNAARTCCPAQGEPTMLDDCEDKYATYRTTPRSIMDGAVTIDAAALARCQAAYADGPDQCNLNAVIAACRGVFIGMRAVDQPCADGYDCDRSQGATTCLISDSSGERPVGVCKVIPHAEVDEPCFSTCRASEECSSSTFGSDEPLPFCFEVEGLYCDSSGEQPVCRPLTELGQPCAAYDECGSSGRCNGTCQAASDKGEPCGDGCIHSFQCSEEGECVDPSWATSSACEGYAPGP
jgi:hypothetical protein